MRLAILVSNYVAALENVSI